MLINDAAIVFNLMSIGLLSLLLATALLSFLSPLVTRRIKTLSNPTQKKSLWSYVALPWVISLTCVFVFLPSVLQPTASVLLNPLAHWHHPHVFFLSSWHSVTLFLFASGVIFVLLQKGLALSRQAKTLDSLLLLSKVTASSRCLGADVIVVESSEASAFVAGLINPKCYVTTGLIEQVSSKELAIIIEHERAHIRHKDTQQKILFALFSSLFPKRVSQQLNQRFSVVTEHIADSRAGQKYCAFDVAQTLVKACRIQHCSPNLECHSVINHFVESDVEQRVQALIFPQQSRSFPWFYSVVAIVTIAALSFYGVDHLHHLVEALFSH